jgi:hypothetical protein
MLDPPHWQTVARIRVCLSLDTDQENQDGERMVGSAAQGSRGNHDVRSPAAADWFPEQLPGPTCQSHARNGSWSGSSTDPLTALLQSRGHARRNP